jgi:hypothetical protein
MTSCGEYVGGRAHVCDHLGSSEVAVDVVRVTYGPLIGALRT